MRSCEDHSGELFDVDDIQPFVWGMPSVPPLAGRTLAPERAPVTPTTLPLGPRRHTILVVDDEPDILESLKDVLEASGEIDVLCADSGEEALRVLAQTPVDLILSDYKMPGMTGLELLHHAQEVAPGTQRMLVTAYPDLQLALQAINDEGVRNVIVKPFEPKALLDMVFAVLAGIRSAESQARAFARALHELRGAP